MTTSTFTNSVKALVSIPKPKIPGYPVIATAIRGFLSARFAVINLWGPQYERLANELTISGVPFLSSISYTRSPKIASRVPGFLERDAFRPDPTYVRGVLGQEDSEPETDDATLALSWWLASSVHVRFLLVNSAHEHLVAQLYSAGWTIVLFDMLPANYKQAHPSFGMPVTRRTRKYCHFTVSSVSDIPFYIPNGIHIAPVPRNSLTKLSGYRAVSNAAPSLRVLTKLLQTVSHESKLALVDLGGRTPNMVDGVVQCHTWLLNSEELVGPWMVGDCVSKWPCATLSFCTDRQRALRTESPGIIVTALSGSGKTWFVQQGSARLRAHGYELVDADLLSPEEWPNHDNWWRDPVLDAEVAEKRRKTVEDYASKHKCVILTHLTTVDFSALVCVPESKHLDNLLARDAKKPSHRHPRATDLPSLMKLELEARNVAARNGRLVFLSIEHAIEALFPTTPEDSLEEHSEAQLKLRPNGFLDPISGSKRYQIRNLMPIDGIKYVRVSPLFGASSTAGSTMSFLRRRFSRVARVVKCGDRVEYSESAFSIYVCNRQCPSAYPSPTGEIGVGYHVHGGRTYPAAKEPHASVWACRYNIELVSQRCQFYGQYLQGDMFRNYGLKDVLAFSFEAASWVGNGSPRYVMRRLASIYPKLIVSFYSDWAWMFHTELGLQRAKVRGCRALLSKTPGHDYLDNVASWSDCDADGVYSMWPQQLMASLLSQLEPNTKVDIQDSEYVNDYHGYQNILFVSDMVHQYPTEMQPFYASQSYMAKSMRWQAYMPRLNAMGDVYVIRTAVAREASRHLLFRGSVIQVAPFTSDYVLVVYTDSGALPVESSGHLLNCALSSVVDIRALAAQYRYNLTKVDPVVGRVTPRAVPKFWACEWGGQSLWHSSMDVFFVPYVYVNMSRAMGYPVNLHTVKQLYLLSQYYERNFVTQQSTLTNNSALYRWLQAVNAVMALIRSRSSARA